MIMTDAEILELKPKAKPYRVSIGNGAYLLVTPNGQKYWRLKYRLNRKETTYALGVFPEVSAKAAQAERDAARALVREGIDPVGARREARRRAAFSEPLFLLALSNNGAVTIETDTNVLTLTSPQTQALAAFLAVTNEHEKDTQ